MTLLSHFRAMTTGKKKQLRSGFELEQWDPKRIFVDPGVCPKIELKNESVRDAKTHYEDGPSLPLGQQLRRRVQPEILWDVF